MSKKAKSAAGKAREIYSQYVDEYMITSRSDLYCSLCSILVKYEKRFFVESLLK